MRSKNTDLMNEIKKFAEGYYLEYWKSPSTSEIAGAVGVTRATVYRYLIDMAERGMIDYDGSEIKTDVTRKYTDPGNNAVILDCSVSCGIGLPEEERVLEYVKLPKTVFGTLNDLFELWKDTKRGIKDSTFQNYIYMYNLIVAPNFGKNRVQMIKKSDVKKFYNRLADGKRMQIATIDNIHNVLHQVFQIAVDDNIIRINPTDNMLRELKMSRDYRSEKRKALTIKEQEIFLSYMKKNPKYQHWFPVFFIMLNTGMRVGELTGLRWVDVDLDSGMIKINHTLVYYKKAAGKCSYTINTTKTEAGDREIPMTEEVKSAFLAVKEFYDDIGMKCNASVDGYTDFIFLNRDGNLHNQSSLNNAIHRIRRDCNDEILLNRKTDKEPVLLPYFTCHHLRHTFATRLCESGININNGHTNEADPNTCILCIHLTDGVLLSHGTRYDIDFT